MKQWAACLQLVVDQAKVVLVIVLTKHKYKVLARKVTGKTKLAYIKFGHIFNIDKGE
jgi:hypothetical protein